ncbi:ABC transporter ATP-binding protein [Hyphomicrobium sp. CS1BSMeth3]|uniref:ABC transporter ATP-binding protein n=1 Tax=Hyphomicrobium sp. CS1BSMeth3 TaxID=1892844 RepID=UPI0009F828B2|nr:ABC transporter ATP-binding protein [Hyphomicrobium sp. CS1BSMeth3]
MTKTGLHVALSCIPSASVAAGPLSFSQQAHLRPAGEHGPALARDPVVRYAGVSRSFVPGLFVVDNLDLDVERGEFITFLGPSGSGKTTTLMLLAGFELPDAGRIHLDGREIQSVPPHRRNIGVVFQNYSLFPHLTINENIAYPLRVRRMPAAEIEDRVRRALDMVKMSGFGTRLPSMLSGGQQQRVALARALVFDPPVILMDEPLGALDKNLREHMQLEIKAIHERLGATFIYVTHDQSEALTMSDRIAVFDSGRLSQIARPETLYNNPANLFVADFMGDNNKIAGRVTRIEAGAAQIVAGDGTELCCQVGPGIAQDAAVVVCIRPERLAIAAPGEVAPNVLPVTVSKLSFLGDHYRLYAANRAGEDVVLKLGSRNRPDDCAPGCQIAIQFSPRDCLVFPA